MSRAIPSALLSTLSNDSLSPFYAVELMFDSRTATDAYGNPFQIAPLRLWTGVGDRDIVVQGSSETFTGTGQMLELSGIDEVNDLSAKTFNLSLTGLPPEAIAVALREPYQRRACRIYFGEQSVSEVVEIFSGKMDKMSIIDEPEDSTISLSVESNLIELERSSNWRYTDENHKTRYAGDSFFSYVQSIQDAQVSWGRKTA